jgi:hypothetical protein
MSKYLAHGTQFSIGSVDVGGLISVGIPDRTRGEAEITDSDSAGDREYVAGLREGGTVELTFRHDPDDAGQLALEANFDLAAGSAVEECVITLPDAGTSPSGSRTYTFDGFVISAPSGDLGLVDDEAAEQSATIKVATGVTISS